MSRPENLFALHVRAARLPVPEREYRFCSRRFRFDFAWPKQKIAVEIQGGIYSQGRHSRGIGQESDYEKLALALIDGWQVLLVSPGQVKNGKALGWVETLLICKAGV